MTSYLPNIYTQDRHTYCPDILDDLTQLLHHYVQCHSKTVVIRFDLHFPQNFPARADNKHISTAIAYLVKKYSRWNLDPMYFWVREQDRSHHHHYHVVLFLNGQKVRDYAHVMATVQEVWSNTLKCDVHGCVHHCNKLADGSLDILRNGLCIRRCDGPEKMQEQIQAVYKQISYLAKTNTKVFHHGHRNFSMSQLPNK